MAKNRARLRSGAKARQGQGHVTLTDVESPDPREGEETYFDASRRALEIHRHAVEIFEPLYQTYHQND